MHGCGGFRESDFKGRGSSEAILPAHACKGETGSL